MVLSALNHAPTDRLEGIAPIKAFLALDATPPLSAFKHPVLHRSVEYAWVLRERLDHMTLLGQSLDEMHRTVNEHSAAKRAAARGKRSKKSGVQFTRFSVGDFFLVGSVLQHPPKLALRWKGPYEVVQVVSDYVMDVAQLVPPHAVSRHQASRLKMYHEGGRDVTQDLKDQIAYGDGGFLVEDLVEARQHNGVWQVLIKWAGLEAEENSWEDAVGIYEDMPVAFKRFCRQKGKNNPLFLGL